MSTILGHATSVTTLELYIVRFETGRSLCFLDLVDLHLRSGCQQVGRPVYTTVYSILRIRSANAMSSSKGLVLVTGANGFIAARAVEALLNTGYSVRGSVRSLTSASALLRNLPRAAASGQLTLSLIHI